MIEDLVNRIFSKLKYRKFKKVLGKYRIILDRYGVDSDEEIKYAEQILERHSGGQRYIRLARKLQLAYESKEEKKMSEPSDIEKSCVEGPSKRADLTIAEEDVVLLHKALMSTKGRLNDLRSNFGINITAESKDTPAPPLAHNRVARLTNVLSECIVENRRINEIVSDIESVVGKKECAKD